MSNEEIQTLKQRWIDAQALGFEAHQSGNSEQSDRCHKESVEIENQLNAAGIDIRELVCP